MSKKGIFVVVGLIFVVLITKIVLTSVYGHQNTTPHLNKELTIIQESLNMRDERINQLESQLAESQAVNAKLTANTLTAGRQYDVAQGTIAYWRSMAISQPWYDRWPIGLILGTLLGFIGKSLFDLRRRAV